MKVSVLQMDMLFCEPEKNFKRAGEMIETAAKGGADVIVLPETWNTGFFPKENITALADKDGEAVKSQIGLLAKKFNVNIVAGSVTNQKGGRIYNTAYVFNRKGETVAEYDKTHLFTPMGEDDYYTRGDHLSPFVLDGVKCAIIICYDLRFPELIRSYTTRGTDCLFVVSQWPKVRIPHLTALLKARAIENQMFVVCANSCGKAGDTVYGGNSRVFDPWGEEILAAGENEEILSCECDLSVLGGIRESINVFRDRRPEIYDIK